MHTYLIKAVVLFGFSLFVLGATGQEVTKPGIRNITTLPSESSAPGNCDSSTAGYLEIKGRTKLTEREIWRAVSDALKKGYVVTVYPQTERGTFVNYECP